MSQNVYDREDFFEEYSKLPRSQHGLPGALEWPLLEALVGNVTNLKIVDLGCGFGWFCRWARERGAKSIYGIDISNKMLERAQRLSPDDAVISYNVGDLETVELPDQPFYDLAFSSLAFHYIIDLMKLFEKVYACLIPGGRFVFSVEHPIFTSPMKDPSFRLDEQSGRNIWPLDSYAEEGLRVRNWLAEGVHKQHRKIDTYVTLLLETGFVVKALKEWTPTPEYYADRPPEKWNERHRPLFLILAVEKPTNAIKN
jgi:SAM-dependent methyltransferase